MPFAALSCSTPVARTTGNHSHLLDPSGIQGKACEQDIANWVRSKTSTLFWTPRNPTDFNNNGSSLLHGQWARYPKPSPLPTLSNTIHPTQMYIATAASLMPTGAAKLLGGNLSHQTANSKHAITAPLVQRKSTSFKASKNVESAYDWVMRWCVSFMTVEHGSLPLI